MFSKPKSENVKIIYILAAGFINEIKMLWKIENLI